MSASSRKNPPAASAESSHSKPGSRIVWTIERDDERWHDDPVRDDAPLDVRHRDGDDDRAAQGVDDGLDRQAEDGETRDRESDPGRGLPRVGDARSGIQRDEGGSSPPNGGGGFPHSGGAADGLLHDDQ